MTRSNLLVFSMSMAWKRSERSGDRDWYRPRQQQINSVLARFLEENDLIARKVTNAEGLVEWDLELMEQNLKPEGVALFWSKYYDRWLDSIDRGTAPEKRRL